MGEPVERNPPAPRFPFVAAALCAACVGMAASLWMRYSYAWRVTSPDLLRSEPVRRGGWPDRALVQIKGAYSRGIGGRDGQLHVFLADKHVRDAGLVEVVTEPPLPPMRETELALRGRLRGDPERDHSYVVFYRFSIDATASRLTGASIAGLVVGAMGVFVFTVAFRHWLGERKAVVLQERRGEGADESDG